MQTITLLGRPKSSQNMYGDKVIVSKGRTMTMKYMKKDSRELKENYIKQMIAQYHGDIILSDISMTIEIWWFGAEVDRDNVHKLSMDAGNGILRADDKQITTSKVMKMGKDNENPRIVLHFEPECRTISR